MRTPADTLSIVEAAYLVTTPEPLWLERIVLAAQPWIDDGHGAGGFLVDLESTDGHVVHTPAAFGGDEEWMERWRPDWWERAMVPMPREVLAAMLAFAPITYTSHAGIAAARELPTMADFLAEIAREGAEHIFGHALAGPRPTSRLSHPEALTVNAIDPSGAGVVIAGTRAELAKRPPGRDARRAWPRIAAHIIAALRVRRRLRGSPPIEGAEAIIDPSGKLLHAEGTAAEKSARASLRRAALDVDRSRTAKVRSTDDALELWRALHEGRWSIVDAFDTDGRRFLVARANEPASDPAPTLSSREQQVVDLLALGHSNKLIAYDLGISPSSVATHLKRAAGKLALASSRDLVRWARGRRRPIDA
jgi:DNA-binding CsgD family transcriptional regulator